MSHKGDNSGFSEMLLGRRKSGGGEGEVTVEGDKGDHNGFDEISCEWKKIIESNSTSNGGDGSTLISGLEMGI